MTTTNNQIAASNSANSVFGVVGWAIVVVLSYLILLFVLCGHHFFGHTIKVGDIAEYDLVAPRKSKVVDAQLTTRARERAGADLGPVMKRDATKSQAILHKVDQLLTEVQEQQRALNLTPEALATLSAPGPDLLARALDLPQPRWDALKSDPRGEPERALALELNACTSNPKQSHPNARATHSESYQKLIAAIDSLRSALTDDKSDQRFLAAANVNFGDYRNTVRKSAERFVNTVGLYPYDNQDEWKAEFYEFLPDSWNEHRRRASAAMVSRALGPNVSMDKEETERRVTAAIERVQPRFKEIQYGQILVARGRPITKEDIDTLTAVGITQLKNPGLATLLAVLLCAAFGLVGIYLHQYAPKLFFSPSSLAMMATLGITVCFVAALPLGADIPQLVPLPAATLILSLTYGKGVSALLALLITIFLWVSGLTTGPHLIGLASAASVALLIKVKRRRDLMLTGFVIGFMQAAGYLIAVVAGLNDYDNLNLGMELVLQVAGGLFSSVLAIGCLPYLESIFGILTPYRIVELSEPDQPLMRQLEENAPGTYQHSLAVANLAEGGARAIGGDVNLVRTGAMYHDIGKMVTPRYFIENQLGDKNPHDFIAPEESRAKVLAHVTNGLALAQKYGLPKAIQAFIPEHQGTTIMAYFYHKACLRDGLENVDQADYRYPGPKPQTKESAIVMLADVSEAVTHSMKDPSQQEVEEAISKVFKARWDDQQFSESGLSIEELERVKQGFLRVWRTLHHDRLKYPSTTTGRMAVPPDPVSTLAQANAGAPPAVPAAIERPANNSASHSNSVAMVEPSCCGAEEIIEREEPRTEVGPAALEKEKNYSNGTQKSTNEPERNTHNQNGKPQKNGEIKASNDITEVKGADTGDTVCAITSSAHEAQTASTLSKAEDNNER